MFYGSFTAPAKVSTFPELSCLAISLSFKRRTPFFGSAGILEGCRSLEREALPFAKLSNVRVRPLARSTIARSFFVCLATPPPLTRQFDVNDGGRREKAQRPILPLRALLGAGLNPKMQGDWKSTVILTPHFFLAWFEISGS